MTLRSYPSAKSLQTKNAQVWGRENDDYVLMKVRRTKATRDRWTQKTASGYATARGVFDELKFSSSHKSLNAPEDERMRQSAFSFLRMFIAADLGGLRSELCKIYVRQQLRAGYQRRQRTC